MQRLIILLFLAIVCMLISACGVSDYINSKKISNAPVYKKPAKTSECDFNSLRIQRVTSYINRIRAKVQTCGNTSYSTVPIVAWNTELYAAAKAHSDDMAEKNFFDHTGSGGSSASDRVSAAGYEWKTVAENIAGGTDTPEQTFEQWLASPGHCYNIMKSAHTEFALACTRNNISDYRIYWTLVLASPN